MRKNRSHEIERFEVIVIGGGSAGVSAAEGAKAAGAKRICVIEAEGRLGGECPYYACVPTKTLLKAAYMYHACKFDAGRYGIKTGRVTFDLGAIQKRKAAVIKALTGDGKRLAGYLKNERVTVKYGAAKFVSAKTIELHGERLSAEGFVIATGAVDVEPFFDGLDSVPIIRSRDAVELRRLPRSVAIIGAGPVGCEFASLFSFLGTRVTLLQRSEHILSREDAELAALAEQSLGRRGVTIVTRARPLSVRRIGQGVELTYQAGRRPRAHVTAEQLMLAVGRRPNIACLGLDQAKVRVDDRGMIATNKNLGTNVKRIFAAGDVTGRLQFTNTAHHEGFMAGWNAAAQSTGAPVKIYEERVVPHVTFLEPELASVGLTVKQATKQKVDVQVFRCPVGYLGRSAIDGSREGLLKVVVERKTGLVIGAHHFGKHAGEIIHELALAMHAKIPFNEVQSMMHAYPTWSEIIPAASA